MDTKSWPSELDELGHIPWGRHFCLFYETKDDLLDIVIPYFKLNSGWKIMNSACGWLQRQQKPKKPGAQ